MQNNQLMRSSIDSLEHNFTSLNITIEKFKMQNQVLSDSLTTLKEAITRSGIKTEFYTDQLNFQLFWFSVLLAVLGFFSWKFVIAPVKHSINRIKTVELPNAIQDISDNTNIEVKKINNDISELNFKTTQSLSWGLKSLFILAENEGSYNHAILFKIRHLQVYIIGDLIEENIEDITIELEDILNLCKNHDIRLNSFGKNEQEILKILESYKSLSEITINELAFEILRLLRRPLEKPETSFDVDQSENIQI